MPELPFSKRTDFNKPAKIRRTSYGKFTTVRLFPEGFAPEKINHSKFPETDLIRNRSPEGLSERMSEILKIKAEQSELLHRLPNQIAFVAGDKEMRRRAYASAYVRLKAITEWESDIMRDYGEKYKIRSIRELFDRLRGPL
ncbi:MAG: hypothetical protein J4415_02445 [Candidatus Diapherotrites archaeon]|uniref:Uncharacterized protein n=1 Tax=Candidatus Iainarchaeum sp. TaxID=3101447 RepID=A0A8T4L0V0_9ARCH|nr:hypothetical protein [Candidatus Diapherotrites archaeon]